MVSAEDDRVHGLAGQLIYHRQPVPKGETRTQRLQRDDRESQIWCILVDQIGIAAAGNSPGCTWSIEVPTTSSSSTTASRPEPIGWREPRT